jgi:septum formation protein
VAELDQGDPGEVARENALRKAHAAAGPGTVAGIGTAGVVGPAGSADTTDELVLGVDTLVALEGRIYGKPADERAARATLATLGGATHTVFSGLALIRAGQERVALARTEVSMRELEPELIDWYVSQGEWRGRAGGYAIQGAGAALVREIRGDYENVVGLPISLLLDLCPELLGTNTAA